MRRQLSCLLVLLFMGAVTTSVSVARAAGDKDTNAAEPPAEAGSDTTEVAATPSSHAGEDDDSWRNAVSEEKKDEARALFGEGNTLVKESLFVQAIEKYEAALMVWDHPAIHYNLALALLNLDQPLRLRRHLLESLKYGASSLGADKATRAEQYLTLVEKQLTYYSVESDQEGTRVEFDGKLLFVAPGSHSAYVEPGQHLLKATQEGYEETERPLELKAGEPYEASIKVFTKEEWVHYERKWPVAGPIILTAAGAAVAGAGGLLYWQGDEEIKAYDAEVDLCAGDGCDADVEFEHSESKGLAMKYAGSASIIAGGAAFLIGGVLLYVNRKRPYRVDPETGKRVSFLPAFAPGYAGILGRGTF